MNEVDIVRRLRYQASETWRVRGVASHAVTLLLREAACEIEKLRDAPAIPEPTGQPW